MKGAIFSFGIIWKETLGEGATRRLQTWSIHIVYRFSVVNLAHYSYSIQYLHYPHSLQPSLSL